MTDNHVDNEIHNHDSVVVMLGLQVNTSTIHGLIHHCNPSFICHEDHQVESCMHQIIEMICGVRPSVTKVKAVLFRIYRIVKFCQLSISIDNTTEESALEHVNTEYSENDDDYKR